jgi:hypothetical protein
MLRVLWLRESIAAFGPYQSYRRDQCRAAWRILTQFGHLLPGRDLGDRQHNRCDLVERCKRPAREPAEIFRQQFVASGRASRLPNGARLAETQGPAAGSSAPSRSKERLGTGFRRAASRRY